MSPTVDQHPESRTKNVSYYFRLGSLPLLFFILVILLSLFIFTGTLAPEGTAILSPEAYQHFAMWYVLLGLLAISLLGVASALSRSEGGFAGDVIYLEDPNKSWKDFVAVGLCTFGGLGLFVVIDAAGLSQTIQIPEPVLQLVVAGTEEFAFRFVLPVVFFLVLANFHPNRDVVFFISIFLAGILFSIFHLFAYALSPYTTTDTQLMAGLMAALVAGVWGSLLYFIAVRVGAGGEWAILGLVIGHYGFNLMKLGVDSFTILAYMGVAYIAIAVFMTLLGYFDSVIKPTSHSRAKNLNRKGIMNKRYTTHASKKNIPKKLNRKWN